MGGSGLQVGGLGANACEGGGCRVEVRREIERRLRVGGDLKMRAFGGAGDSVGGHGRAGAQLGDGRDIVVVGTELAAGVDSVVVVYSGADGMVVDIVNDVVDILAVVVH